MESEKVKEIKKGLEFMMRLDLSNKLPYIDGNTIKQIAYEEIFNYINELESTNEWLSAKYKNLEINYNDAWEQYREYEVENRQLKDRIADLEKENTIKTDTIVDLLNKREAYEAEKLKHFAERLKEKVRERDYVQGYAEIGLCEEIDETLKEFINGKV